MTLYVRKPNPVQAFQFTGQRVLDDIPEWLRNFSLQTGSFMGSDKPILNAVSNLMIPVRTGVMVEVVNTDWVVMENGELWRFKDTDFHNVFITTEVPHVDSGSPA